MWSCAVKETSPKYIRFLHIKNIIISLLASIYNIRSLEVALITCFRGCYSWYA